MESIRYSLTHLLTHSLTHLTTYSLTHSAIKVHPHTHPFRELNSGDFKSDNMKCKKGNVHKFKRAILLIRNPYDSIWSEYQRRITQSHVDGYSFTHSLTLTHSLLLTHSLSLTLTHSYSLTHSLTHSVLRKRYLTGTGGKPTPPPCPTSTI